MTFPDRPAPGSRDDPSHARARAEFTIYPFERGQTPPRHVQAAIEELQRAGLDVEVGLLSQTVSGDVDVLLEALRAAQAAAVAAGATRIVISLEVER